MSLELLKQLREAKPTKVSFRVTWNSTKIDYPTHLEHIFQYKHEIRSRTAYRSAKGESFLETLLFVLLDYEKDVSFYLPQSVPKNRNNEFKKLEYISLYKKPIEWIPDVGSIWKKHRPIIFECKSIDWINSRTEKEKLVLHHKWTETKKYVNEELNADFVIFTDEFMKSNWRIDNLMDIFHQMQYANAKCEEEILNYFKQSQNSEWTVTKFQDLLKTSYENGIILGSIFHLIFTQELYIDIDTEELKPNETVIYLSDENHKAISFLEWLKQYNYDWENLANCFDNRLEDLSENDIINRENLSPYQIEWLDRKTNIINDIEKGYPRKLIQKNHKISHNAYYSIRNIYIDYKKEKITYNQMLKKFIPDSHKRGKKSFELFKIVERKPVFLDKKFEETILRYETPTRPNKKDSWDYYWYMARKEAFDRGYAFDLSSSLNFLLEIGKNHSNNFIMATNWQFLNELNRYITSFKLKVDIKREGYKYASKMHHNITGTTPYSNFIGQMAQIDHSLADIINKANITSIASLVDNARKRENDPFGGDKDRSYYMERPTITIIIDVHTGVILSYLIRYRKASTYTDFIALRRMILGNISPLIMLNDNSGKEYQKYSTISKIMRGIKSLWNRGLLVHEEYLRIKMELNPNNDNNLVKYFDWWDNIRVKPFLLHADNGRDLTSKALHAWTGNHKIPIHIGIRPVGGSQYGGKVERAFGTLQRISISHQEGTTKSSIAARRDYASQFHAILTFDEIEAIFLLSIAYYHTRSQGGNSGISPMRKWIASEKKGHNLHFLPQGNITELDEETKTQIKNMAWDLMPTEKRNYTQKKGIYRGFDDNNVYYNYSGKGIFKKDNSEIMDKSWKERFNNGAKIKVKIDPSDIRYIWWWNPDLDLPIRVWATELFIFGRKYSKNQLMRKSPISEQFYRDSINSPEFEYLLDIEDSFDYDSTSVQTQNLLFSIESGYKQNKSKKRDKIRIAERQHQESKESDETVSYLDESDSLDAKKSEQEIIVDTVLPKKSIKVLNPFLSVTGIKSKRIKIPSKNMNPFVGKRVKKKKTR